LNQKELQGSVRDGNDCRVDAEDYCWFWSFFIGFGRWVG
jgi:hypothetical protein